MILADSSNSELHAYMGTDRGQSIVGALFLREESTEGNIDRAVNDGKMNRT